MHIGSCLSQTFLDNCWFQNFLAQNAETGEIARQMGNVDLPDRTWVPPAESEDWDLGNYLLKKQNFFLPASNI